MNIPQKTREIKTSGYVLRRTNYGEADRILNIITPEKKLSAIAKGVRRPKSKLAGGVELFTLADLVIHQGRGGLGIVTSAKMKRHYGNILMDYDRMELAGAILREVSRAAESADAPEYFRIVDESLAALDSGAKIGLVEAWADFNLLKAMGEEPNFYRDDRGEKLSAEARYEWNTTERAFALRDGGRYGADEIKVERLMMTAGPKVIERIKGVDGKLPDILLLARVMVK